MEPVLTHSWKLDSVEAIHLQRQLNRKVILTFPAKPIRTIAGADVAFSKADNLAFAAVVMFDYISMAVIEEVCAHLTLTFPYIPGLLSFREGAVLLKAFAKLKNDPDLVIFDGQGIAHPRRFGIASHLGVLLNLPTIGCAKSRLIGTYEEPGRQKGDFSNLYDRERQIGIVLRTRKNVKPLFISPGNRMDFCTAGKVVLHCAQKYRLPEPTRLADRNAALYKKKYPTFKPDRR